MAIDPQEVYTKDELVKVCKVAKRIVEGWLKGEARNSGGEYRGPLSPLDGLRFGDTTIVRGQWILDFLERNRARSVEAGCEGGGEEQP